MLSTNYRGRDNSAPLPEDLLRDHLSVLATVEQPGWVSLEELIKRSESFTIPFPTNTAKVDTLLVRTCWAVDGQLVFLASCYF